MIKRVSCNTLATMKKQDPIFLLFRDIAGLQKRPDKETGFKDTEHDFTVLVIQTVVCPVNEVPVKVPNEALKEKAGDILDFHQNL